MGTQTQELLPTLISYPTNLCTLQDVILDSPVWRSNIEQLHDQIELFEKWLEGFVRVLKHYIEAVTKVNSQTTHLCKLLNLDSLGNGIIDFQIAGTVINAFQDNLQCSLTAKIKLVNDISETLLKPLHDLLKIDVKEFKEMKKTYEKVLDKYENYLCRYSVLSKQKEPSALREDTFQLFDVQKSYIHTSGDYFLLLITLKSKIEHTLVDCFSCGVIDHMDALNTSMQSSNSVKTMVSGWRRWLDESQKSTNYQYDHIKKSSQILVDAYIKQIRPHRSLKRYSTSQNDLMGAISHSSTTNSLIDDQNTNDHVLNDPKIESNTSLVSSPTQGETINNGSDGSGAGDDDDSTSSSILPEKHGYLFTRVIVGKPNRYNWVRRWFFLKDGWLGQYTITTVNKVKGCLVIDDRIQVSACESKIYTDTDRRFCFEIKNENGSFILQAESEKEMHVWLWAIEKAKEISLNRNDTESSLSSSSLSSLSSSSLLSLSLIMNNNNLNTSRILLSQFAKESIHKQIDDSSQPLVSLSSFPPKLNSLSNTNTTPIIIDNYLDLKTSTMASLTKLLLEEDIKDRNMKKDYLNNNDNDNDDDDENKDNESIISLPPPIPDKTPSSTETFNQDSPTPRRSNISSSSSSTTTATATAPWSVPWLISGIASLSSNNDDEPIETDGWIFKSNNINEPDSHIIWPNKVELDTPDVTLENYSEELKSRNYELRKYFSNVSQDEIVYNVFTASIYNQQTDQLNSSMEMDDKSTKEKGYSGTAYVTQKNIWFYSCKLMTCVNATIIPLKNIKSIRLEKVLSTNAQGMLMNIDTVTEPSFTFGLWLDAAELIGERLRILIEYAKESLKLDEQALFDTISNLSIKKIKSKAPTIHLSANTTPNISVTPLTVQAQSNIALERQSSLESFEDTDHASSSSSSPSSTTLENNNNNNHESSDNYNLISSSPAAGALTAAMEAANEALNKAKLQKSKSSNTNTPNRIVTPPPPPIPSNSVTRKKSTSSSSTTTTTKHKGKSASKAKKDKNSTKPLPRDPVDCECQDHLEKEEANIDITMSAKALYQCMFENDKDRSFWNNVHKEKGNSELNISKWQQNNEGKKERTMTYLMPVNNPMVKVKEAEVIETQEVQKEVDGLCYVVLITTKTPMLPYADAFIPTIKLCITYNTSNSCSLRCSTGVKWLKSIMVKGMVSRAAFKGMSETIAALIKVVEETATHRNIPEDDQQKNNMIRKRKEKSIKSEDNNKSTADQMLQKENHSSTYQKWKKKLVLLYPYNLSGTLLSPPWLLGYCLLGFILLLVTSVFNFTNNNNLLSYFASFLPGNNQTFFTYDHDYHSTTEQNISWRAVYINDLDTIIYGNGVKLEIKSNSRAYELFKKSRKDIVGWTYRWFNVKHKLIASEMSYTREQIATLRYELLTAFKLLNNMEQRLMQSEYWNWLLDQKIRCENDYNNGNNNPRQLISCTDINNELDHLD